MTDQNAALATENSTDGTDGSDDDDADAKFRRNVFEPDQMAELAAEISRLAGEFDMSKWLANFNMKDGKFTLNDDGGLDIPENHAVLVYPIKERVKTKNAKGVEETTSVVSRIVLAAMPTVQTLNDYTDGDKPVGADFIISAVYDKMAGKVASAARQIEKTGSGALPISIADFVERQTRGEAGSATFAELGPKLLKVLRKRNPVFATINLPVLRRLLSNSAFASAGMFAPFEENGSFEKLLDMLITMAETNKLDPKIFHDWKRNRQQATFEVDDQDITAGLDALLASAN